MLFNKPKGKHEKPDRKKKNKSNSSYIDPFTGKPMNNEQEWLDKLDEYWEYEIDD